MKTTESCAQCGSKLLGNTPAGLCPQCLIKLGWPSETSHGEDTLSDQTDALPAGTPPSSRFIPPEPKALEAKIPGLEVLALLGQGGMGAVYRARQTQLDRIVALKVLPPEVGKDPAFAERFTREARSLAKLSHAHIVTIHDFGQTEDNQYYFIMEFVDGTDLRQILREGGLTGAEALAVVPQICEALQYAHEHGVVHRDIKPENILLDRHGSVKIGDFGLAKLLDRGETVFTLTEAGQKMGTPHYMAPEQVAGAHTVDHRADIYSLGVVFYEMLTGQLPIGRFTPPSQKAQIDVRLDQVVLKSLENEPERRYQHASELKTDIESITPHGRHAAALELADGETEQAATTKRPAVQQLRIPAVGLFITALFSCAVPLALLLFSGGRTGFLEIILLGVILGSGLIVIAGAWSMFGLQSYALAVTGSIVAMFTVGFLLGLPMGIWALVVLNRSSVQNAFATAGNQSDSPRRHRRRPLRLALAGLVVILLALASPLVIMLLLYFTTERTFHRPEPTVTLSRSQGADTDGSNEMISGLDFPSGTPDYVELSAEGPVVTKQGVETLDLTPSEHLALNTLLQDFYREFREIEASHMTMQRNGERLNVTITSFRQDALSILESFWLQHDRILDVRKQSIARRHLPLKSLFGTYRFGEPIVRIMVERDGRAFNYEIDYEWPEGSQQQGGGGTGRALVLPAELQRFWDASAEDE